MLVYLKNPMAYTTLDGKRIYGKKFSYGSFGPTDISPSVYKKNKYILEEAEYTKDWLDKRFDANFPRCNFTLSNLYKLDLGMLINIAACVGIEFIRVDPVSPYQKSALIRAMRKRISRTVHNDYD